METITRPDLQQALANDELAGRLFAYEEGKEGWTGAGLALGRGEIAEIA